MKRLKYLLIFIIIFGQAFTSVSAQIKVACIGNSITYGSGLDNRNKESYPMQLKALLEHNYPGKLFDVRNYGIAGVTLLKDSDDAYPDVTEKDENQWSYWEYDDDPSSAITGGKDQYNAALTFAPNILIIKLGTNDARLDNWPANQEDGKSNFYKTYVEFIESFRANNPNVTIYICYSIPYFKDSRTAEREQARVIAEEVIPIIKQVARKNNVHLIDLHSAFFDKRNLTSDDVHPTLEGASLIANEVFKMLQMTYDFNK